MTAPTPTALEQDCGPAVYRTLLADLSTWPAAFQRRIGEPLREARDGEGEQWIQWSYRPDRIWDRFQEGRRAGMGEEDDLERR